MTPPDTSLAATLRVWRDRLSPEEVGLPAGRARRAAGLRREELADLAGLSVDYVVRLEQGRATTPSAQVVAALARALQLSLAQRDHLYTLAGLQPPGDQLISDHISPGVQRLLTRLGEVPIAVFGADWRLIWWNDSWSALLGDPLSVPPAERSFARSCFPARDSDVRLEAWPVHAADPEATARAVVSDLRRASARYPQDRRLAELLALLSERNRHFDELWRDGAVGEHTTDRKTIEHPTVGEVGVDCEVLHADADLKIVTMTTAAGSEDESKIKVARLARPSQAASRGIRQTVGGGRSRPTSA